MALFTKGGGPKPEQSKSFTPTAAGSVVTPDAGYTLSQVTVNGDIDLISTNIKSGVNIFGVAGDQFVVNTVAANATPDKILSGANAYAGGMNIVGTIPSKGAQTYTPGTSNQTIAAGQYLSGVQTIAGDADLVAANIKSGVNIFGVVGSLVPGSIQTKSVTVSYGATSLAFTGVTLSTYMTAIVYLIADPGYAFNNITNFVIAKRNANTILSQRHAGGSVGFPNPETVSVSFSGTTITFSNTYSFYGTYNLVVFNME